MSQTEVTRQSDEILPPIKGSIIVLQASSSVLVVDLTTWPQTACLPATTVKGSEHTNPLGAYVSLTPDGSAVYVAFSAKFSDLAGMSTTQLTTVNGTTGAISVNGAESFVLPANSLSQFRLPPGPTGSTSGTAGVWGANSAARYMGLLTAASTVNVRCYVSSR